MGVIIALTAASVDADPGAESVLEARVENTGQVVDRILIDVLGAAKEWAEVDSPQLNLLPGTSRVVQVAFKPPRDFSVPAGEVPFGLRAMSHEDPDGSQIVEGVVRVAPFSEIAASLVPRTATGRRHTRFKVVVENRGNHDERLSVSAEDPDAALAFRVGTDAFDAPMGRATIVKLRVTPKKRFLKGARKTLPFQVRVRGEQADPVTVDGAMVQRQAMPEWLPAAVAAVFAVAVAAVVLSLTLFKPAVHSSATGGGGHGTGTSGSTPASASTSGSGTASSSDTGSSGQSDQSSGSTSSATGSGSTSASGPTSGSGPDSPSSSTPSSSTPSGSTSDTASTTTQSSSATLIPVTPAPPVGTPVSATLQADAAPSTTFATYAYPVPAGKTLNVSDIVLQNPAGDTGRLQVRAGGTVLFEFGLGTVRSVDERFAKALQFTSDDGLVLAVECQNPAGTDCTASITFSGGLA